MCGNGTELAPQRLAGAPERHGHHDTGVVGHREAHPCPAVQCKLHSGCFRSTLWVLILPSLTRACSVGHCAVTGVGKARQTHGAFAPFEVEQAGIRARAEQIRSSGST